MKLRGARLVPIPIPISILVPIPILVLVIVAGPSPASAAPCCSLQAERLASGGVQLGFSVIKQCLRASVPSPQDLYATRDGKALDGLSWVSRDATLVVSFNATDGGATTAAHTYQVSSGRALDCLAQAAVPGVRGDGALRRKDAAPADSAGADSAVASSGGGGCAVGEARSCAPAGLALLVLGAVLGAVLARRGSCAGQ